MQAISTCQKVIIPQGVMYLGESNENFSVGYLELNPFSSLTIHNRDTAIENLTQVKGKCVMIIFDKPTGTNHLLHAGESLRLLPQAVWHIHANPFDEPSLTYWHFEGDIREVIEEIRKSSG